MAYSQSVLDQITQKQQALELRREKRAQRRLARVLERQQGKLVPVPSDAEAEQIRARLGAPVYVRPSGRPRGKHPDTLAREASTAAYDAKLRGMLALLPLLVDTPQRAWTPVRNITAVLRSYDPATFGTLSVNATTEALNAIGRRTVKAGGQWRVQVAL